MSIENDLKEQLTEISEKQQTAWESFKETHTKQLEEVKKTGVSQTLLDEKLAKISEDLDKFDKAHQEARDQLEKYQKEQEEKLAQLETQLKRPDPSKGGAEETDAEKRQKAFGNYLRFGKSALSADDRKLLQPVTGDGKELSQDLAEKVLTSGDDTGGGYLAPPEFVQEIIKGVIEFSPIRSLARVMTTARGAVRIPKRTATFSASWVAETGTRSETTGLAYGIQEIPNHELYALVDISNETLEDSAFNLEAELRTEFAEQFGVAEGTAFVSGNGVGRPEGIIATNSGVTSRTSTGSSNTVAADDLITVCYTDLMEAYARNATWLFKRSQVAKIRSNDSWPPIPGGHRSRAGRNR
jgi:HK97 family phage major capsid protein